MSYRTVIQGNAFYEVDEECLKRKQKEEERKKQTGDIYKQKEQKQKRRG